MALAEVDFESFKCAKCGKYLSVPPIYVYPDSNEKDQNVCGRCEPPMKAIRNTTFESLAKILKFPCSISKNCQEKLTWGNVKHETTCQYREIVCPLCGENFSITGITSHFRQTHKKYFFQEQNLILRENDISNIPYSRIFLMVYLDITCWVKINIDSVYAVEVEPLLEVSEPHVFTVTFGTDDNMVRFKNKPIKQSFSIDMKAILEIFKSDKEFQIQVEISAVNKNQDTISDFEQLNINQNPDSGSSSRDSELVTVLKDIINTNLKCQMCYETMHLKIYTCATGHSICDFCKNVLTVCRLCQGAFLGARNFSLEEISRCYSSLM